MKKEYRNVTRTKKMIRAAFVDLIEEKKLINNITVAELAERADIAKSTFYNHYDDVYSVGDEILNELLRELDEIIDAMEADHTNDYRVYIKRIFAFLRENKDIYSKVAGSPDAIYFIDRIKNIVIQRVLSNINSPYLSKIKSERQVQISFIANACVDTMVNYFKGDIKMSFDELEKTIMRLIERFL
jgi:AcrR family transcriptional regulator